MVHQANDLFMGRKLNGLLAALKDTAVLTASTSPTDIAVLRATPRRPSAAPPSPSALSRLLSFGRSSRLSATALVRSLTARLSSAADPAVALKALLCLHHLLAHSSFILADALAASLSPSSGRRCPLTLSSFHSPSSLPLSCWVRWYARLLELLLAVRPLTDAADRLTSLLNSHLIAELDSFVAVVEELARAPDEDGSGLVAEVAGRAAAERGRMQRAVGVRVREVKERLTELGFADCVELDCVFRRLEGCGVKGREWVLFWREAAEVRAAAERGAEEGRGSRVRARERASESARIGPVRVAGGPVLFGSARGFESLS